MIFEIHYSTNFPTEDHSLDVAIWMQGDRDGKHWYG